jgi:carbamoyl-phosphate synthase large subunit
LDSILIFGGGDNQRTLIKSAKKLGYRTIVIDPDPEALARNEADIFEVIGGKDKEATISVAKKYGVKGIVTSQMENPLLFMAEIAEEMGFIFPSRESVQKARNKWLMKRAFLNKRIPCAKGVLFSRTDEIAPDKLKDLHLPLIIKPVDSYSSRGVYKINTFNQIIRYLSETRKFSGTGDIIIEEFLDGPEVSVESITCKGVTHVIQITDKEITDYPYTVEMSHIQPSFHNLPVKQQIKELVIESVNALSLDNCVTHAEVKITPDGAKIIEIGARLGGDYISSHLVPLSTGVSLEEELVKVSMGIKPEINHKFSKGSAIRYLNLQTGQRISKIFDWKHILYDPDVRHAMLFAKENETVPLITDSSKRMGFVIVQGNSRQEALLKARVIATEMENKIKYN